MSFAALQVMSQLWSSPAASVASSVHHGSFNGMTAPALCSRISLPRSSSSGFFGIAYSSTLVGNFDGFTGLV